MRKPLCLFFLAVVGLALAAGAGAAGTDADLVLLHGRVYTVDAARSWAEAVAVRGGRIVYVGSDEGARRQAGADTRVVDLAGRMVLPAFRDSHVHPLSAGVELGQCDLNGAQSVEEVEKRIRDCAAARPEASWLIGGGWDLPLFPDANPRRERLDTLVPDRPAFFSAADGHSAWVNSAALRAAGITAATPDPPLGRIERDPSTGEPSGTLREDATELVSRHAPEITAGERLAGLRRALDVMNGFGIVGFVEASAGEDMLDTYLAADREGWLTARVRVSLYADPAQGLGQVDRLVALRDKRSRRVAPDAVKLFVDGVIESRTAALLEPYLSAGKPGATPTRGLPNWEPEALSSLVTSLDAAGFQIHMHAIGDRAIRMGLDAVAAARSANGSRDARPQMAHIQLYDPADIPRFRRLGVVADFQPLWAFADTYITDLTEPVLGPERSRWLYPIQSLFDSGAVVAAGSDWSVSSVNPLDAIQVAVTRRGLDAGSGEGWIDRERADLPEMIAAYTIAGAYVAFEETESGSIETGKLADLVVLDQDLFEMPPEKIHTARVVWTLLEGETVFRDDQAFDR